MAGDAGVEEGLAAARGERARKAEGLEVGVDCLGPELGSGI